eukprot:CAMPEP_0170509794 /NCGR_PEP_ID=MMETSP0208-20121228/65409_1 /TAXON_ID=197538 /ORGANISM="Strombidium inclinatum, Strain S3" /LENGTH=70 /DNA_ID=CAMNT_0010793189 /DNA_START=2235 /DNA_END=2447 /DNA_ORIENTATION=+
MEDNDREALEVCKLIIVNSDLVGDEAHDPDPQADQGRLHLVAQQLAHEEQVDEDGNTYDFSDEVVLDFVA